MNRSWGSSLDEASREHGALELPGTSHGIALVHRLPPLLAPDLTWPQISNRNPTANDGSASTDSTRPPMLRKFVK